VTAELILQIVLPVIATIERALEPVAARETVTIKRGPNAILSAGQSQ